MEYRILLHIAYCTVPQVPLIAEIVLNHFVGNHVEYFDSV
jgi:hypothetical protein